MNIYQLNLSSLTTAESQQTLDAAFDELKPAEHEWRQLLKLIWMQLLTDSAEALSQIYMYQLNMRSISLKSKSTKSDSDGSRVGWHASSLIYSDMNMVKKTELLCQHVACPEPSEQEQHDALPCF